MDVTPACAVTRSEVRSTVHPYEAAVTSLVNYLDPPTAFLRFGADYLPATAPNLDGFRDNEGGLEFWMMRRLGGRRIL